jgi:hypothetical protein
MRRARRLQQSESERFPRSVIGRGAPTGRADPMLTCRPALTAFYPTRRRTCNPKDNTSNSPPSHMPTCVYDRGQTPCFSSGRRHGRRCLHRMWKLCACIFLRRSDPCHVKKCRKTRHPPVCGLTRGIFRPWQGSVGSRERFSPGSRTREMIGRERGLYISLK